MCPNLQRSNAACAGSPISLWGPRASGGSSSSATNATKRARPSSTGGRTREACIVPTRFLLYRENLSSVFSGARYTWPVVRGRAVRNRARLPLPGLSDCSSEGCLFCAVDRGDYALDVELMLFGWAPTPGRDDPLPRGSSWPWGHFEVARGSMISNSANKSTSIGAPAENVLGGICCETTIRYTFGQSSQIWGRDP